MSGDKLELLCFRVGGRVFALDIMNIREILRRQEVTPVPGAPPHVAGVVNLRGELVPVIDLDRGLLGGVGDGGTEDPKLVVARTGPHTMALLVEQVLEVVSVPVQELLPLPGGETMNGVAVAAFRADPGDDDPGVVLLVRLAPLASVHEEALRGTMG